MATENIGSIYPTKIPGIADSADIQVALKTYHYGSSTAPATRADVVPNSIAGYIRALEDRVAILENQGIGSTYQSEPPTGVSDGFVWIDSDTASPVFNPAMVSARYQTSAPTTDLVDGQLWVDKDSTPLKIYVYDAGTTAWRAIGS